MKREKLNYSEMSSKCCKECNRPIKQNVIDKNSSVNLCYVCFKVATGKFKVTKHKVVNGEKIVIKHVNFKDLQAANKIEFRK